MTNLMSNWWDNLPPVHQFGIAGAVAVAVILLITVLRIRSKILQTKIEYFLFNNGYHSINPKNNSVAFPKVIFKKNQIVLKNCFKKTAEQIRQDKEIWERTFNKQIKGKRVGDVKFDGTTVRLALV